MLTSTYVKATAALGSNHFLKLNQIPMITRFTGDLKPGYYTKSVKYCKKKKKKSALLNKTTNRLVKLFKCKHSKISFSNLLSKIQNHGWGIRTEKSPPIF